MKFYDICVIGAGHSGLVTALAFAKNNFKVLCVETKTFSSFSKQELELRTTAHLLPTVSFLETIGVWKNLQSHSCPLKTLKIINDENVENSTAQKSNNIFQATEISQNSFGFNVPLKKSITTLCELALNNKNIKLIDDTTLISSHLDKEFRIVHLSNDESIKTKLLIGADGSDSVVRSFAGINVFKKDTGQTALTFNVKHTLPHKNISNEVYKVGGSLTTVPILDNTDGLHSSIVWMNKKETAEQLMILDRKEFNLKLNERSLFVLGEMSQITEASKLPVKIMVAQKLVAQRIVLIGEAAHKLPPIGAQGFNMSVKDIETLLQLSLKNADKLGGAEMLSTFQFRRYPDILAKAFSVGVLNKLAASEQKSFKIIRALGLRAISDIGPLKRGVMRFGLG